MGKEIRYLVYGYEYRLYMAGDRVESMRKSDDHDDLGDYATQAEAVRAAKDYLAGKKNMVHAAKRGIGSVDYYEAEVDRCVREEEYFGGWVDCDANGLAEGEEGYQCDGEFPLFLDTLEGSREERAFDAAVKSYHSFLDSEVDGYDTVLDMLGLQGKD